MGGLALFALALLGTACRAPGARVAQVESLGRPIPAAVVAARRALRAHDTDAALALLEAERGLLVTEPERSWLLAHVWASRFQTDRARRAAAALPRSPFRTALEASLAEDVGAALRTLEWQMRWPPDPWMRLAAAYLHSARGMPVAAEQQARSALGRGVTYVDVEAWLVVARSHADAGRLEAAGRAAKKARALEPTDVRAHAISAALDRLRGDWEGAVDSLVEAIRVVPENRGQPRFLARILRRAGDWELAARAEAGLAGITAPGNPEWRALWGLLAEQAGRREEAVRRYRQALAEGAIPIPVDRHLRRLLFASGAYEEGVEWLVTAVPPAVIEASGNLQRPAWARLQEAAAAAPSRATEAPARLALAEALVAVGALPEARSVLAGVEREAARALDERLARQIAFEDALEDDLEGGYRQGHRRKPPASLDALLDRIAEPGPRTSPAVRGGRLPASVCRGSSYSRLRFLAGSRHGVRVSSGSAFPSLR